MNAVGPIPARPRWCRQPNKPLQLNNAIRLSPNLRDQFIDHAQLPIWRVLGQYAAQNVTHMACEDFGTIGLVNVMTLRPQERLLEALL